MCDRDSAAVRRWHGWILSGIIAIAAVYVFWDATRPFNQTDEFLYAEVTQRMLESGDYVTPRFASIELLTKPPLFYWLSAPVVALIEPQELAMRLLPGISFLLSILLIYHIVRRHWSARTGLAAALVFFLCYDHLFNHAYKAGVMEGVLNCLIVVTFWLNTQLREAPGRLRWIAATLALAFLVKSVFFAIPLALTVANIWPNRRELAVTKKLVLQALAIFCVIISPWLALVLQEHGSAVFDYMIVDQIWSRAMGDEAAAAATGRTFGRTERFYVIRHFLEYGQPWSFLVWPALWSAFRLRSETTGPQRTLILLCSGWLLGVLLLFLLAQGRWSWYISSVYVPASILISAMFREFWRNPDSNTAPWIWAGVGATFLVSDSPFLFNPYAVSSGQFPLLGSYLPQFLLFLTLLAVVTAMYRHREFSTRHDSVAPRAVTVLGLASVTTVLLASRTYWDATPPMLIAASEVLTGLACVSTLLLVPVGRSSAARTACLVCPFLIAAGYIAAPLGWSAEDNRREEIKFIERAIIEDHFLRNESLEISPMSLFNFIPVYATFQDEFDVTYSADDLTINIVPISARTNQEQLRFD